MVREKGRTLGLLSMEQVPRDGEDHPERVVSRAD